MEFKKGHRFLLCLQPEASRTVKITLKINSKGHKWKKCAPVFLDCLSYFSCILSKRKTVNWFLGRILRDDQFLKMEAGKICVRSINEKNDVILEILLRWQMVDFIMLLKGVKKFAGVFHFIKTSVFFLLLKILHFIAFFGKWAV